MTKLDWLKASLPSSDPARVQPDGRDDSVLASTPAAQKERKLAEKAKRKAAALAAKTRKLNREQKANQVRQAAVDAANSAAGEKLFWANLRTAMANRNARRRIKSGKTNPPPPADPPATS